VLKGEMELESVYREYLEVHDMLPKRPLGKTGFNVTLLSLGGEAAVEKKERPDDAEAIIHRALDLGINYIDTSPVYGETGSETNIGRVMASRRAEVFLATKSGERTYDGVMRQIEESLKRLQTDHLDLYQMHDLRMDAELKAILAKGGALEAFEKLKDQKVIRHIGVTSHKDPALMLEAIRAYPFATALVALNVGDVHHASFKDNFLPEAVQQGLGIVAMKATAAGRLKPGETFTMKEMLEYVFTLPISNVIVGIGSLDELEENIETLQAFSPLADAEMKALEDRAEPLAYKANFFKHEW
jgi:uncharacterized protein